ncbi:MAG: ABC transporter permease [Candidatus Dormibacteraeota bacterium]|nr:ABC transporter permease [Candidatus Dormibacteraeota bacterium]
MARFVARRALYAIALLLCASILLFLPGPLIQYLAFLKDLVQGDLGSSTTTGLSVLTIITQDAPYTITLGVTAAALTYGTAIPLGILAAWKRNTAWDRAALSLAVLGMGIPNFFLAILLIQVFAVRLHWLPVAGADTISNLVLPAVVLAFESIAINLRLVRTALLEELGRDYVRTLHAKGLSDARVLWVHALRNALPVILALAAIVARNVLGYTLIVEVIFRWPGLGHELVQSVLRQDHQEARVLALLLILAVIVLNFFADVGHHLADPLVRLRAQAT